MYKKLTSVILCCLMLLGFSGCDSGIDVSENINKTTEEIQENTTEAPTEAVTEEVTTEEASEEATEEVTEEGEDYYDNPLINEHIGADPLVYAVHYTDYYNNEDGVRLYTNDYDELSMPEELEEQYPGIKKAIDDYNDIYITAEDNEEGGMTYSEMIDSANEMYKNDEYFNEFFEHNNCHITRLDSNVLSIVNNFSNYTGGAHGYYGLSGDVYDAQTGTKLSITDVVTDISILRDAALEVFSRDYSMFQEEEPDSTENLKKSFDDPEQINWSMGPESISLYYNPYDLGSYAGGNQVLEIKFSNYPGLFKEGYAPQEGDWCIQDNQMSIDIDSDGADDYINVTLNTNFENNYQEIDGVTISAGSKTATFGLHGYEGTTYLVKKDDKYYAYIDLLSESDQHVIWGYSLSGDSIKELGYIAGSFASPVADYDYGEGYYISTKGFFYNPNCFYKSSTVSLISTYGGICQCYIDNEGNIKRFDDYYSPSTNFEFVSKKELTLDIVDKDGSVVGNETLPSGTSFYPYRTDDEKYVDLQLDDGRLVRVEVDHSDYPYKVNGDDLEDVFDGILFAG